jgi:hypothetical protein
MARMTPAALVIKLFGIRPLARDLGCSYTTVWRWRDSDEGLVPAHYHKPLLDLASKNKIKLTAEELVYGRVH